MTSIEVNISHRSISERKLMNIEGNIYGGIRTGIVRGILVSGYPNGYCSYLFKFEYQGGIRMTGKDVGEVGIKIKADPYSSTDYWCLRISAFVYNVSQLFDRHDFGGYRMLYLNIIIMGIGVEYRFYGRK